MPMFDLPRAELRAYSPTLPRPEDLEEFWASTLQESRGASEPPTYEKVDTGVTLVDTYDVSFSGFGGDRIKAWLRVPAGTTDPLPTVVRYHGYGGGRGLPHEVDFWTLAGYASMSMDTRGQGGANAPGDTPDPGGSAPSHPGFMTRGILDPHTYFYRRVFTDAVLAVDAVRESPLVDGDSVAVCGRSQGGALSLAAAALGRDVVAVMPDVPFLCDFRRATDLVDTDPYGEIVRYLKVRRDHVDQVFRTLSYFDCALLAGAVSAPGLFSVGLMDPVCPPSTVYAAYNAYAGEKEIREYAYNEHEGGAAYHEAEQLAWLRGVLRGA
jgi:cephalosporin-C deacetylase